MRQELYYRNFDDENCRKGGKNFGGEEEKKAEENQAESNALEGRSARAATSNRRVRDGTSVGAEVDDEQRRGRGWR